MPPIHCVNCRQRANDFDRSPKSVMIVAPVAVNPRPTRSTHRAAARASPVRRGVGKRPECGQEQPQQGDDQESLADPNAVRAAREGLHEQPGGERDRRADEKGPERVADADRQEQRHEERDAEVLDERSDEVERAEDVDPEPRRADLHAPEPERAHRR